MKTKDIVVGGTYKGANRKTRIVIKMLPHYKPCAWMENPAECVDYQTPVTNTSIRGQMTIKAFAAWAKERVDGHKEGE